MVLRHLILFKFILLFISIQCLVEANVELSKIIRTLEGQVQGLILKTVLRETEYSSFRGIPYAQPPVGDLRFKPPVKFSRKDKSTHPGYYHVFPAMRDANMCPQFDLATNTVLGNEDCLYLNVYTPEVEFNEGYEKRAVMVWIHGGAFMWGSNNSSYYGPDFFIEKNVVIVAMNYRLGAFGFFAAGNLAEGNMGLKDQVMALQWVKDNIIRFGGDPNKVTIFGESAGAVSVELHRLSLLSTGLFRASIAMSGSPLNPWAFNDRDDAESMSAALVKLWDDNLGIISTDDPPSYREMLTERAVDLLRDFLIYDPTARQKYNLLMKSSVDEIVRMTHYLFKIEIRIPFLPTTEYPKPSKAFLTEMPEDLYKKTFFSNAPHILGYTENEFIGIAPLFKDIYKHMYGLQPIIDSVASSVFFENGIDKTRKYLNQYFPGFPVWQYINKFDYPEALHKIGKVDKPGCGHADDIAHIFYIQDKNQPIQPNFFLPIALHREIMTIMWTNFAKHLHPVPEAPNAWEPSSRGKRFVLLEPNIAHTEPLPSEDGEDD